MSLLSPIDLQLTSNHNGDPFACRIYLPQHDDCGSVATCQVAVVAHPYPPLGGSYNDPVVVVVANRLASMGFVVGTFNFSKSPSWTLMPETADYARFVTFLVHYASHARASAAKSQRLSLVLGGYSYGSFVASRLGQEQVLSKLIDHGDASLAAKASELAQRTRVDQSQHGLPSSQTFAEVDTSHLLISPLLAPVTYALAPFHGRTQAVRGRTLTIFGTRDLFTSSKRLLSWARNTDFEAVQVDGADHFWRDEEHEKQLLQAIEDWATNLITKQAQNVGAV